VRDFAQGDIRSRARNERAGGERGGSRSQREAGIENVVRAGRKEQKREREREKGKERPKGDRPSLDPVINR